MTLEFCLLHVIRQTTADLLTVVSDTIARAFNGSRVDRLLYMPKNFDRVCYSSLPHKLKSHEISGWVFGLLSSYSSSRRLPVVMVFLKAPFLVLLCS